MAQQVPLAGAVIVSTPQDLALIDARKGLAMFRKVEVPVLGIVENMSYFIAPDTGTRYDIFGHGGARKEAERIGVPFLGEVPLTIGIRETSDAGTPVVVGDPDSPHAKSIARSPAKSGTSWHPPRADAPPRRLCSSRTVKSSSRGGGSVAAAELPLFCRHRTHPSIDERALVSLVVCRRAGENNLTIDRFALFINTADQ